MRHLDLFSGIGGFALAASWIWGNEHELVSFCDNDKAAQIVLSKHWPGVPIHDDIKTLDATKWRGTVDLVTGGFPCQPFSCAGKRRGAADDRYLWPEMLRVIAECQPRWVLGENVPGIINMELDGCLASLEGAGYEVGAAIIPACSVGAFHIRSRIWIMANSKRARGSGGTIHLADDDQTLRGRETDSRFTGRQDVADANVERCKDSSERHGTSCESWRGYQSRQDVADAAFISEREPTDETHTLPVSGRARNESINGGDVPDTAWQQDGRVFERRIQTDARNGGNGRSEAATWPIEPALGRVANGVPYRVDRLRLLGNAIVPQVAEQIFRAMKVVDGA